MQEFQSTNILRKNPALPLTAYFDPIAYGLKPKTNAPTVRAMKGAA